MTGQQFELRNSVGTRACYRRRLIPLPRPDAIGRYRDQDRDTGTESDFSSAQRYPMTYDLDLLEPTEQRRQPHALAREADAARVVRGISDVTGEAPGAIQRRHAVAD